MQGLTVECHVNPSPSPRHSIGCILADLVDCHTTLQSPCPGPDCQHSLQAFGVNLRAIIRGGLAARKRGCFFPGFPGFLHRAIHGGRDWPPRVYPHPITHRRHRHAAAGGTRPRIVFPGPHIVFAFIPHYSSFLATCVC